MNIILFSFILLVVIALIAAAILFFVAKKFKVEEDPRIDTIAETLPGANCGGCGFAGCRALAEAIVKNNSLDGLMCPVGGNDTMQKIAPILGVEVAISEPMIAVVRCSGSISNIVKSAQFDGLDSCRLASNIFVGESACPNGCIGLGDCVKACQFEALIINPTTGLPEISNNCVACGACAKKCPRGVIEMRKRGAKDRRIYVSCINKEKGAVARKHCNVACIGCGKCAKVCQFDAITIQSNVAYIDYTKCRLCRKCAAECPTGAIVEMNFPERKPADETATNLV